MLLCYLIFDINFRLFEIQNQFIIRNRPKTGRNRIIPVQKSILIALAIS
jgi:hypothetical protein